MSDEAPELGGPLLGRWTPAAGSLAWVARLARDEADAWLSGQVDRISAAAALPRGLPERMLASATGEVAFAVGPDAALRAEFSAVKGFLEGQVASIVGNLGALSDLWQRARWDAGDVFDQLGALLQGGVIETHSDARRLVARSVVDWSGDVSTAWTPGARAWEVTLHRANVELALHAREAALAGIAAAARGAARLAAAIAAPAPTAAALTLPLAWRYLRRLWRSDA